MLFEKRVFFASKFIVISQLQEHIVSFTVTVTVGREDILVISTINAHGCKKTKQNKTKTKTKQKRPDIIQVENFCKYRLNGYSLPLNQKKNDRFKKGRTS